MSDHTPTATGDPVPNAAPALGGVAVVDLATQLDALRIAAGRTAALADVTIESYDQADWRHAEPAFIERTTYLLGAVAEGAVAVVTAVDRFQGFVADQTRSEVSNDEWW